MRPAEDWGRWRAYQGIIEDAKKMEQEEIIDLLLNQKCDDENCMCDTTNFHIELIRKRGTR